jgi:hypothetical protein
MKTMVNKNNTYHDKTLWCTMMESTLMHHNYSIADSDHELTF